MRIKDIDPGTLNHVTFYNEYFKRGRKDLLATIQRSTNRGKSQLNHIETLEAKIAQLSRELSSVRSRLLGMTNLEDRIEALEVKLGQDNQFDNPPIEHEKVRETLHSPATHHTLPNFNTTNSKSSSNVVQHSVRQQLVRCSNSLDPAVTASKNVGHRTPSPHTTHSNKEDSAQYLFPEISNNRELNENITHQDSKELNVDQHHHAVSENVYSRSHKIYSHTISQDSGFFPRYGPSMGNIVSNPIIDEHEHNTSQISVRVTKEISLNALQSGISQFWQTLVNQRGLT